MNFKEILLQDSDEGQGSSAEEVNAFLDEAHDVLGGKTPFGSGPVAGGGDLGWMATKLGVSKDKLKWRKGTRDVPEGRYCELERKGVVVLIHESREFAYVEKCSEAVVAGLKTMLEKELGIFPLAEIQPRSHSWTLVAQSHMKGGGVQRAVAMDLEKLAVDREEIASLSKTHMSNSQRLTNIKLCTVGSGDLLYIKGDHPPGMLDVFGQAFEQGKCERSLIAGHGVAEKSEGLWQTKTSGFLQLRDGCIESVPPVLVDEEGQSAHYLVTSDQPLPSQVEFEKIMIKAGVKKGIVDNPLEQLETARADLEEGLISIVIAKAKAPENGRDAEMIWKVDPLDCPGKILEDGTIDYREGTRIFIAERGDIIAEKVKATKGSDGWTVRGDILPHRVGHDIRLEAGENVTIEENPDRLFFKAMIKGSPRKHEHKIEVAPSLIVPGGVNFNTGNIEFPGDILIDGSVQSGFSVKSGANVIIYDAVENGAYISCRGELKVGKGIIGAKTKVIAGGDVTARFIQEATLMGGRDLLITDHIYHARVRCEGKIKVDRCSRANRSGSIVGGYVWGLSGINAHFAGSPGEIGTTIGVGVDEWKQNAMKAHQKELDALHQQVLFLITKLGIKKLSPEALNQLVETKPHLAEAAARLKELINEYQSKLKSTRGTLVGDAEGAEELGITLHNRAYPGVSIYHGRHSILLKKTNFSKHWLLRDNLIVGE